MYFEARIAPSASCSCALKGRTAIVVCGDDGIGLGPVLDFYRFEKDVAVEVGVEPIMLVRTAPVVEA